MGLDSNDYSLVSDIRKELRKSHALNEKILEELERSRRVAETAQEQQRQMLAVFNRVATGIDKLNSEIQGLRADITPKMDKPLLK